MDNEVRIAERRLIVEYQASQCTEKKSASRFYHGVPILNPTSSSEGERSHFLPFDPINGSGAHVQLLNLQHRLIVVCIAETNKKETNLTACFKIRHDFKIPPSNSEGEGRLLSRISVGIDRSRF